MMSSLEKYLHPILSYESYLSFQAYVDYLGKQAEPISYFEVYQNILQALELTSKTDIPEAVLQKENPLDTAHCTWFEVVDNIHTILITEFADFVSDPEQALLLANATLKDWQQFDLNQSITNLIAMENTSVHSAITNDVTCKIMFSDLANENPHRIEAALYILKEANDPSGLFNSIEDPHFQQTLLQAMKTTIEVYEDSHWYDYGYFWLDSYLDVVHLGYTDQTYENYSSAINLGKELKDLLLEYPDTFNPPSVVSDEPPVLKWEDVFGSHGACASKTSRATSLDLAESTFIVTSTFDPITISIEGAEFAKTLI